MGYATTVGTMVLNNVALVNKLLDSRMDAINTVLVEVEQSVERGQDWSRRHMEVVRGMEVDVGGLMALTAFMRGEQDWMRREMDGLLQLNIRMHKVIMELRAAVCHGRDNLIVINDDKQEEGEVVEAGPMSLARTLVEGDHTLVEIVEGTLSGNSNWGVTIQLDQEGILDLKVFFSR